MGSEKNPVFYMIADRLNETRYWEPCRSRTMIGAKREARHRFRGGYIDETVYIRKPEYSKFGNVRILCCAVLSKDRWYKTEPNY